MNGIRLAAFTLAAVGFLQLGMSEASAQTQGYRGPPPGIGQEQPAEGRSGAADNKRSSRSTSRPSSRSRRSSSRSSRSNNAIKTNPLFQFLDSNGDGELSLEEIDAASRMIHSFDANGDDAITSDEVEDMVVGGDSMKAGMKDGMKADDEARDSRSARSSRSTRDRSSRSSRTTSKSKVPMKKGMNFAGMGADAGGSGKKADDDDFGANDKNDDGFLSRSEMPRSLRTKFTKIDTNGDKEIDENEFYDYIDNN